MAKSEYAAKRTGSKSNFAWLFDLGIQAYQSKKKLSLMQTRIQFLEKLGIGESEWYRLRSDKIKSDYQFVKRIAEECLKPDPMLDKERWIKALFESAELEYLADRAMIEILGEDASKLQKNKTPQDFLTITLKLEKLQRQMENWSGTMNKAITSHQISYPPLQRPPQIEHFVDREEVLEYLVQNIHPGRRQILSGPSGIGKSALMSVLAWRLAPKNAPPADFPDGIVFYSFYKQPQVSLAFEHIALTFGEVPKPTPLDAVRRVLSKRKVLLLLDDIDYADNLSEMLSVVSNCGVLMTSQKRDLPSGERYDLTLLPTNGAIKLLQKWARDYVTDEVVTRQICELTGRLPLAVRLAGQFLNAAKMDATDYLQWLEESPLQALETKSGANIRILIEQSIALVDETAQNVLGVAGILALTPFRPETIAAALEISIDEVKRALAELVNYGLLEHNEHLYEVTHRLIYVYAQEYCTLGTEIVKRLATYYIIFANNQQTSELEGFTLLDAERLNIMAVFDRCVQQEMWELTQKLALAIHDYLDIRGYWTDRITTLQAGLNAAQALGIKKAEGKFLGDLGNTYSNSGRTTNAIECLEQARTAAEEINDDQLKGYCLSSLGITYSRLGYAKQAIDYYEQALTISREIGDQREESTNLGNLGIAYQMIGDIEGAIDCYRRSLDIDREIGNQRGECNKLGNMGAAYNDLGQVEQATKFLKQALVLARKIGDRGEENTVLGNLGVTYSNTGQVKEAFEHYEQALSIAREIGDRYAEIGNLGNLGLLYSNSNQTEQAIEHYQYALAIAQEIGDRRAEEYILGSLGDICNNLEQIEKAVGYYQQALDITRKIGNQSREVTYLRDLAKTHQSLGLMDKTIQYYEQALRATRNIGNQDNEITILNHLGVVYHVSGEMKQAIDHYQQALILAQKIDDPDSEFVCLNNLGMAHHTLQQVVQAIDYYEQALSLTRKTENRQDTITNLGRLGLAYGELGQVEKAIDHYAQAVETAREIGSQSQELLYLGSLGNSFFDLHKLALAVENYQQAISIAREISDQDEEGEMLWRLGFTYQMLNQMEKAKQCFQESLAILKEIESPNLEQVHKLSDLFLKEWE